MRISLSENYHHGDFECTLKDCERQYCRDHRTLWRDCDTDQNEPPCCLAESRTIANEKMAKAIKEFYEREGPRLCQHNLKTMDCVVCELQMHYHARRLTEALWTEEEKTILEWCAEWVKAHPERLLIDFCKPLPENCKQCGYPFHDSRFHRLTTLECPEHRPGWWNYKERKSHGA